MHPDLNPHCGQRSRLNVDSTLTTSAPGVSSSTSNTRICGKCSRTVITSAIGALLDRRSLNHRFQQGLDPYSGTLNHPAPHITFGNAVDLHAGMNPEFFYFGCEADDRMTAVAFDERLGTLLKPVFSSDVGHFDVTDMSAVLAEAWELVEDGLITEANFEEFTFGNAVDLHAGMNPEFFVGTVVEEAVASRRR